MSASPTTHASHTAPPPTPDECPGQRMATMVTRYHARVWRALRRFGVGEFDADDACQQVFLVAHRRLAEIVPANELAFLLQTALRVAADVRRSRRRRHEEYGAEILVVVDTADNPEEMADRRRAREMLDRALDEMPRRLREVLVLFEIEELSLTEVGAVLRVPRGTVASRLRRARQVFRDILSQMSSPRSTGIGAGAQP